MCVCRFCSCVCVCGRSTRLSSAWASQSLICRRAQIGWHTAKASRREDGAEGITMQLGGTALVLTLSGVRCSPPILMSSLGSGLRRPAASQWGARPHKHPQTHTRAGRKQGATPRHTGTKLPEQEGVGDRCCAVKQSERNGFLFFFLLAASILIHRFGLLFFWTFQGFLHQSLIL